VQVLRSIGLGSRVIGDGDEPIASPTSGRGTVVTIGAYDGVHLGHRAVIAEVRRLASERDLASAVITFDRHPAEVVRPESAPKLLTDLAQKLELLESTGVDTTLVVHFDAERSTETAEDFIAEVIVGALGARVVVVGDDFHFGKDRRGNVELLTAIGRDLGPELGFDVVGLNLFGDELTGTAATRGHGPKISSTRIRNLLREGDMRTAASLLGRTYEVRGPVVHGDARGRGLGYPTANIAVPAEICLPADGIYAGWYHRPEGLALPAALNLGRRPTFQPAPPLSLLEAFVIDWSGDLYGEPARIQFVERLRDEMRFESVDALVAQMRADVERSRTVLGIG
jgi:riboflavin kinase/FMN adenylyltransferase